MKGLSAITVAAVVAVSSSAFAAKSSTKSTGASSTTSTSVAAPAPSNASPSGQAAASPTAGTITAPAPVAKAKPWSTDLYLENYWTVADAEKSKGQMEAAAFASVNRKLENGMKVYLRQNASANIEQASKGEEGYHGSSWRLDDTEIGLGLGKVASWANEGNLTITNRFYLPTGKYSQRAGKIAQYRAVINATQPINKHLDIGATLDPRVYAYSKDSFRTDNGTVSRTKDAASYQYGWITGKANDDLSATVALGTYNALRHHGHSTGAVSYLDVSASAQVTKALALTLGMENDGDISSSKSRRHAFLRNDETQYYFNMFASM